MVDIPLRALILFFLTLPAAFAGPILNVTLSPSSLTGNPGQLLTFSGTLENTTGGEVFINSNSFTFQIAGPGVLDDSPFLSNAPFSLTALETSASFDFFTVTIPIPQADDIYTGVFSVLGGADELASELLGTVDFSVTVEQAAPGVPEPGTMGLLGVGLGLLLWMRRQ